MSHENTQQLTVTGNSDSNVPVIEKSWTLKARIALPPAEPVPLPTLCLEPLPDRWTLHHLDFFDPTEVCRDRCLSCTDPSEMWDHFVQTFEFSDVSFFVPPGEKTITLPNVVASPYLFQVFDTCRSDLPRECWHRLEALSLIKLILAGGGSPVTMSLFLQPDDEWSSESVKIDENEVSS